MATELGEGEIFAGRYRVVSRIASGGMGTVYEVLHLETNRRRALKIMHPHIVGSGELNERFQREARVTAEIESEFIVDVFDAGVDRPTGRPFLVMELLRGEEVGRRLRRLGRLSPADVVTYLSQVAVALDKTHAACIVHRDLKPENLFLTARDDGTPRIKILDFGVAKLVAEGTTSAGVTSSVGTPLYMAPEQFRMDSPVSPAADRYALGMIAYTLLVGQPYWAEEARRGANVFAFAVLAATGVKEAASARALRVGARLPPAFDAWFATATAVDPTRRFPSAIVAVGALAEVLGVPAPPLAVIPMDGMAAPPSSSGPPIMPAQTEIILSSADFMVGSTTTTHAATVALRGPSAAASAQTRILVLAVIAGMSLGGLLLVLLWPAPAPPVGHVSQASSAAATGAAPTATASAIASASVRPSEPATSAPPPSASPPPAATTASAAPAPEPPRVDKPRPAPLPTAKPPSRYSPD